MLSIKGKIGKFWDSKMHSSINFTIVLTCSAGLLRFILYSGLYFKTFTGNSDIKMLMRMEHQSHTLVWHSDSSVTCFWMFRFEHWCQEFLLESNEITWCRHNSTSIYHRRAAHPGAHGGCLQLSLMISFRKIINWNIFYVNRFH